MKRATNTKEIPQALILEKIKQNYGYPAAVAEDLGISRSTLTKRLEGKKGKILREAFEDMRYMRNEMVDKALFKNATINQDFKAQQFYLINNLPEIYGRSPANTNNNIPVNVYVPSPEPEPDDDSEN